MPDPSPGETSPPITCGDLPEKYPTLADWERACATVVVDEIERTD
jgi:hypothetical protein